MALEFYFLWQNCDRKSWKISKKVLSVPSISFCCNFYLLYLKFSGRNFVSGADGTRILQEFLSDFWQLPGTILSSFTWIRRLLHLPNFYFQITQRIFGIQEKSKWLKQDSKCNLNLFIYQRMKRLPKHLGCWTLLNLQWIQNQNSSKDLKILLD